MKLGRWDQFLAMRQGILGLNARYRSLLSNDLGALAGLLFDISTGRYPAPPRQDDDAALRAWEADLARVREPITKPPKKPNDDPREGDHSHTEIQGWLRNLGLAVGYDVWVAANDRNRPFNDGKLGDGCLDALPVRAAAPGADAVRLIDVLWLDKSSGQIVAAYEVEHTTSIYSGIVRMLDLALGTDAHALEGLFLVAPDDREKEVRAQLQRPAFSRVADLKVRYLPYGELLVNREAIARFGQGMKPIQAISRLL